MILVTIAHKFLFDAPISFIKKSTHWGDKKIKTKYAVQQTKKNLKKSNLEVMHALLRTEFYYKSIFKEFWHSYILFVAPNFLIWTLLPDR